MFNNHVNIVALIFAQRTKPGLDDFIDEEQFDFMSGRNICNNVRLILDMIDYNQHILDDSWILFVDFYKAFDTISHQFQLKTMKCFGFRSHFMFKHCIGDVTGRFRSPAVRLPGLTCVGK